MHVITRQGVPLAVTIAASERIPGSHHEPIIEFRYPGGILCSSYFLSTFLSCAASKDGLMLEGGRTIRQQSIDFQAMQACADFIARECES
jgi:hypothetical protein